MRNEEEGHRSELPREAVGTGLDESAVWGGGTAVYCPLCKSQGRAPMVTIPRHGKRSVGFLRCLCADVAMVVPGNVALAEGITEKRQKEEALAAAY